MTNILIPAEKLLACVILFSLQSWRPERETQRSLCFVVKIYYYGYFTVFELCGVDGSFFLVAADGVAVVVRVVFSCPRAAEGALRRRV